MNVLVIGSGGREHALVWKLRQSPSVRSVYCAPGNAGIGKIATLVPLKTTDMKGLLNFAQKNDIDLTVVGPEQSLVQGIVDQFEQYGMSIFGPTAAAARLEESKIFAKEFMMRHEIPTATHRSFSSESIFEAERYVHELPPPIVIKADGLAAGKGVLICQTKDEATAVLQEMMISKTLGSAGERIVIEEHLAGEEASILVLTDGEKYTVLPASQDHKRILDGDVGKNTGGMGAYAPAPIVTDEIRDRIVREIIEPTLRGMREEGYPFSGCLYVGLMITETGPKVIEYNCRFGDPEAQVVIPLLTGDFGELLFSIAKKKLQPNLVRSRAATAVCVVMASRGYPDQYETGKVIRGLDALEQLPGIHVFHAGTRQSGDDILTSGGRVLGVTAIGEDQDLEGAIQSSYRAVNKIVFDGAYYRSDIGRRALDRLKSVPLFRNP